MKRLSNKLNLKPAQPATIATLVILLGGFWGLIFSPLANARPFQEESTTHPEVCAVLEKYSGATQIVDDAHLSVIDLREKAAIPCGSWVSVESGWSEIRHQNGFLIHLRQGSYIQVSKLSASDDPIVLFRGEIFAQAGGGNGELRILTPNSRVRLSRGSVIASFAQDDQRTEMITVDGTATLENRFEESRRIQAKAGQVSSLDFKILRVIPALAKPISTASLQAKLRQLHVPPSERERAVALARKSREESFSPALPEVPVKAVATKRAGSYPAVEASIDQEALQEKMISHLNGEDPANVFDGKAPTRSHRKAASRSTASVKAAAAQAQAENETDRRQDAERKQLIESLSKISDE
jgi:hypothetical protein